MRTKELRLSKKRKKNKNKSKIMIIWMLMIMIIARAYLLRNKISSFNKKVLKKMQICLANKQFQISCQEDLEVNKTNIIRTSMKMSLMMTCKKLSECL